MSLRGILSSRLSKEQKDFILRTLYKIQSTPERIFARFDFDRDKPVHYPIALSETEVAILKEHLKECKNYLEFGAGASTFLALMNSEAKIISVESDPEWLNLMRRWKLIRENENVRCTFKHVDIGPVGAWGVPVGDSGRKRYPLYSVTPFEGCESSSECPYDLIFIDGRFRVACTMMSILHAAPRTKIIIHDFTNRPEYHTVKKFLNTELECTPEEGTMCVFTVKPDFDRERVRNMYEEYKYNFD